MPDINDMLGGMEPQPEQGSSTGLENLNKALNAKDEKKKVGSEKIDPSSLEEILMTGENTDGMFALEKTDENSDELDKHEETNEDAKRDLDGDTKVAEKYAKKFKQDIIKNPDKYKIQTSEGEMTVAEAIKRGYNPITGQFDEKYDHEKIKERNLSGLNDADRDAIERITSPEAAQVAPADASKYGLQEGSPFIRQDQPQQVSPMMGTEQGAGVPVQEAPQAQTPVQPAPQGSESGLAALLGG